MILRFVMRCIHIYDMHKNYSCTIQVVSNMFFSGSSYSSREERVLRSHLDTLRDIHDYHARQLTFNMHLIVLFSRIRNGQGLGEARSGQENSLDLSMT